MQSGVLVRRARSDLASVFTFAAMRAKTFGHPVGPCALACVLVLRGAGSAPAKPAPAAAGPFTDYRGQAPGRTHLIRPADLPPAYATPSADNPPRVVARPRGAWPKAPPGFKVELY